MTPLKAAVNRGYGHQGAGGPPHTGLNRGAYRPL